MSKVGIVDYDCGNLFSVQHAFEKIGAEPYFCHTPEEVIKADRLLLPGVGAFGDAVSAITQRGLTDALLSVAHAGRPIMGVCLGMQLLAEKSEESKNHNGLGLIPGRIVKLPVDARSINSRFKIPNVGWSRLNNFDNKCWRGTPLNLTREGDFAYFVHSFHLETKYPENVLATQSYGDIQSPALIARDNIHGCQFHPERSGEVGLKILKSWMEL